MQSAQRLTSYKKPSALSPSLASKGDSAATYSRAIGSTLHIDGARRDFSATGTTARAIDQSGYGNHGEVYSGRAMQFDGVADYITTVAMSGEFLEAYIGTNSIANRGGLGVYTQANGWVVIDGKGNTWEYDTAHRFVYVFTSTRVAAYLDGAFFGSVAKNYTNEPTLPANGCTFAITASIAPGSGQRAFTDTRYGAPFLATIASIINGGDYFQMNAADAQYWSRAWTDEDVAFDYNNPERLASERPGTALDGRSTGDGGDLSAWYPMTDGFSSAGVATVFDISGNGKDGTNVAGGAAHLTQLGGIWPQQMYRGWSRYHRYTQASDAAIIPYDASLEPVSGTFAVWLWAESVVPPTPSFQVIFGQAAGYSQTNTIYLRTPENGQYAIYHATGRYSQGNVTPGLHLLTIAHEAMKGDPENLDGHIVHLDGVLIDNRYSDTEITTPLGGDYSIGSGSLGPFLIGTIPQMLIFNKMLDPSETAELWNNGVPLADPTTHSAWNSNCRGWIDNGESVLREISGSGLDAVYSGTQSFVFVPENPVNHGRDGLGFPLTNPRGRGTAVNDGASWIKVPHSSSIQPTDAITVGCWAKSDNATWNSTGSLVSKRLAYVIHPNEGNNTLNMYVYSGGNWWSKGIPALEITDWHFYLMTFDGSTIRGYVDGVELPAPTSCSGTINADTGILSIGADDLNTPPTRILEGQVSDTIIIPAALTPGKVARLFNLMRRKYGI